jgi:hypothetical protein
VDDADWDVPGPLDSVSDQLLAHQRGDQGTLRLKYNRSVAR